MLKKLLTTIQLQPLVFILTVAVTAVAIGGDLETAEDNGPAELILKSPAAIRSARFPHKQHQKKFKCDLCHHSKSADNRKMPYVQGMKIKNCVFCHNKDDMKNPRFNTYKLAAHGLCKECHKNNRDTAPTKCSGCHIK